jgi:hypothetical protein
MPYKTDMAEGTPRWVKVFGVVALLVIAVVLVLILTGRGGPHSPRRHISPADTPPAGGTGGHTGPPPGITHTQP